MGAGGTADEEKERKLNRMRKFGIPVVSESVRQLKEEREKIAARKEKFGLAMSEEDQEKKLKRMQRFGLPVLEAEVRPLFEQERKKKIL